MFELKSNSIPISTRSTIKNTTNLSINSIKPKSYISNPQIQYLNTVNNPNIEKLDDILNDIECIQETKEHHVKIEFNWLIDDIIKQIDDKLPGEKIESEDFFYKKYDKTVLSDSESDSSSVDEICDAAECDGNESLLQSYLQSRVSEDQKLNDSNGYDYSSVNCDGCKKRKNNFDLTQKLSRNGGKLICELICDYFIQNSCWQLELSINEYFGMNSSESVSCANEYISINAFCLPALIASNKIIEQLKLEKFKNFEYKGNLLIKLKFYILDAKFENVFDQKTVQREVNIMDLIQSSLDLRNTKFSIEKYCKFNELTSWLSKMNSKDFAFLCEFRIYFKNDLKENDLILKTLFKHIWTIRNWQVYLIENKSFNTNDALHEFNYRSLLKFQSKSFFLKSAEMTQQTCKEKIKEKNFVRNHQKLIDYLLKQIKWKLQLYPRGYSDEFSNNLSLFLNFNEISRNLKDFVALKLDNRISLNELYSASSPINAPKTTSLHEIDMILLAKPKFNTGNSIQSKNQFLLKKFQEKNNKLTETFVKACFQISIVDDKNTKIDVCETEKQLFELYGSWGYKEYLLANDLIEIKEKYLKNNYRNLHLNCIIKLYYTTTIKFHLSNQYEFSNECNQLLKSYKNLSRIQNFKTQPQSKNAFLIENFKYDYLNSLNYDLSYLYKTSHMYDVIIQAPIELTGDDSSDRVMSSKKFKSFKVHKLILSMRSIIFEQMFNYQNSSGCKIIDAIQIIDFNSFTVNLFLKYLYTDSIQFEDESDESEDDETGGETNQNDDDDDISSLKSSSISSSSNKYDFFTNTFIELFKISDKYCVYKLKNLCEMKLISDINNKNLINLLIISHLHNSKRLKQGCFDYLAKNLDIVVKQKRKLNYLEINYPNLLAEAFRLLYLNDV